MPRADDSGTFQRSAGVIDIAAMQLKVDCVRDQGYARVFVESGWSQEKLAEWLSKREGKEVSQRWVSYHLLFGRFLTFFRTNSSKDCKIPSALTEWQFRKLWESSKGEQDFRGHRAKTAAAKDDEHRRFAEVMVQLNVPHPTFPRQREAESASPPAFVAARLIPPVAMT
jgi:hypothetical protein